MTRRPLYYPADEMQKIITRSARLLGVDVDLAGASEIAARARGTPRTANNLLRWVRDYVQVKAQGKITGELADRALAMLEIDRDGFDQWDKRIIETLIQDRKSTRLNSSHLVISYAVFCLQKKKSTRR